MIAAICSKSERFNESMAQWFYDSGSSIYIFLDNLPSQTGICLNNGRWWKITQKQLGLLVLQYKGIMLPLEYWTHWEALIVAEVSLSEQPLPIQDFILCVDYVLLSESILPE